MKSWDTVIVPLAKTFMSMSWWRCLHRKTIFMTVATGEDYWEQAIQLAGSAKQSASIPCLAIAIADDLAQHSALLEPVQLLSTSSWRPSAYWCRKKLSGWRQTSVLKMAALHLLLTEGVPTSPGLGMGFAAA